MKRRSLRDIARQRAEKKDLRTLAAELQNMEDRPAAIVAATLVEDAVQDRILGRMKKLSKSEYGRLFLPDAPLGTFSAKIRVANALKVLYTDWARQIDVIRDIRNVFAHARSHIDFKTPEIVDNTMRITVIEDHRNPDFEFIYKGSTHPLHQIANSVRLLDPRSRYIGSCLYLALALWDLPADPDDWDEGEDEGNT